MSKKSGCFSCYFDAQLPKITKVFVFPLILFVIFIIILVGVYKLALLFLKKHLNPRSQGHWLLGDGDLRAASFMLLPSSQTASLRC